MINRIRSNGSPVDREWHAICNAIKPSCSDFSSPLGNNMAIFSLPPLSSLSHTLTLSLSPCCLATVLVNVIPLVCDWLKGQQFHVRVSENRGRHTCTTYRRYKLTTNCFWSISLAQTHCPLFPMHVISTGRTVECSVHRLHVYTCL